MSEAAAATAEEAIEDTSEEVIDEVATDDDGDTGSAVGETEEADDDAPEEESEEEAETTPAALDGDEWEAVSSRPITRKVNGKDVTRTVAEWVQQAQKAEGAEAKFDEASRLRKEAQQKADETQKQLDEVSEWFRGLADPDQLVDHIAALGKPYQLAFERAVQQHIAAMTEEGKLTPEQKRLRQLEREIEAQKRDRARAEEERKRREAEQKQQSQKAWAEQQLKVVLDELTAAGFSREKDEAEWKMAGRFIMGDLGRNLERGEPLDPAEVKALVGELAKRLGKGGTKPTPKPKPKPPPVVKTGGAKKAQPAPKRRPKVSAGSFFDELREQAEAEGGFDEIY